MAGESSTESSPVDDAVADAVVDEAVVDDTPAPPPPPPPPEHPPEVGRARPRRWLVFALTLLAGLVMFLAAISTWVDRQALDTEHWVDASDALLADDDIREALSRYIVDEIYANVDVAGVLEERLPSVLDRLAAPAAAAIRGPATDAVERLLGTDQARDIWERVNREAHAALVRVLEDETRPGVSTAEGTITIQLGELIRQVGTRLGLPAAVIDRIPEDAGTVTVIESDKLAAAQDAVTAIKWASVLLFFVVVALFVAAVALARGWRAIALRNVGLTAVVVGLLLLVTQRVGRNYVLNNFVELSENRKAAAAVLAIGTELLRDIAWNIFAVGVVIALAAALLGPSRAAVRVRRFIAPVVTASPAIVWGIAAAVFFLIVIWGPLPALETWYGFLLAAVLLALLVEALRRRCLQDAAEPGPPESVPSEPPEETDTTEPAESVEARSP
jgi:hypothetical protein